MLRDDPMNQPQGAEPQIRKMAEELATSETLLSVARLHYGERGFTQVEILDPGKGARISWVTKAQLISRRFQEPDAAFLVDWDAQVTGADLETHHVIIVVRTAVFRAAFTALRDDTDNGELELA